MNLPALLPSDNTALMLPAPWKCDDFYPESVIFFHDQGERGLNCNNVGLSPKNRLIVIIYAFLTLLCSWSQSEQRTHIIQRLAMAKTFLCSNPIGSKRAFGK